MLGLIPKLSESLFKLFPRLLFIFSLLVLSRAIFLDFHPDFAAYYYGAEITLAGANPYPDNPNYHTPNAYPMFVYLLFSPYASFSFFTAQKIWVVLSIVFLILSFHFIFKMYNESLFESKNLLISGLILLTFFPTKFTLGMGQINIFILFLTVLSIYFYHKKKELFSSLFLGLSVATKFFPVLLLLFYLKKRRFNLVLRTILVFLIANILGILVFGIEYTSLFYQKILPDLLGGWKGDYYNQALTGFLTREIADEGIRNLLKILISGVLVILSLGLLFKKTKNSVYNQNLTISLLITLSVLVNNFSWQHHFVWLLFPFLSIYLFLRNKKNNFKLIIILAISFVLVALNFTNPSILPSILQSHVFFGGLMLWGLNYYLLLNQKVK